MAHSTSLVAAMKKALKKSDLAHLHYQNPQFEANSSFGGTKYKKYYNMVEFQIGAEFPEDDASFRHSDIRRQLFKVSLPFLCQNEVGARNSPSTL